MGGRTDLEKSLEDLKGIDQGSYLTLQEGKNVFRILPAWTQKGPYAGKFFFRAILHYGFTVDGRARAFPCLRMYDPQASCPACAFVEALREDGSKQALRIASALRPQLRFYVNVINRKSQDPTPQIYGFRKKQMVELRSYLEDPDYGDITDPRNGRDVVIEKTGQGLKTRYSVRVKPKTSPIGVEGWEDKLHRLDKEVLDKIDEKTMEKYLVQTYGKLYSQLMGLPVEKIEEEEEPEEEEQDELEDEEEDEE